MRVGNLCEINWFYPAKELEIALFGFPAKESHAFVTGWKLIIYLAWAWPPIYFRGEWSK